MPEILGLNKVGNVLFDFDGTLVDSREAVLRTFSEFAATFGVNATEQVIGRFDGLTTYEIVETAKREWNICRPVDELTEQYFRLLAAAYAEVAEHSGAFTVLKALEIRDRRLGLVTSAPQQLVEPVLERLGWTHLFGCKIFGKPGAFGKPHPALYRAALNALGADPANVIAVEDSVSGVRSATAAGIRVVAVASALMHVRLKEAGAILVVDDLEALLRVLER